MKIGFVLFSFLLIFVAACSPQQETTQTQEVFEDIPHKDDEEPEELEVIQEPVEQEEESVEEPVDDIERKENNELVDDTEVNLLLADGMYSETGEYRSPGGTDTITVTLEVKDDIVQDVTVEALDAHRTSQKYIAKFDSGIDEFVVGKRIDELDIPEKVSGSSLTSKGFQDALDKIIPKN